MTALDEFLKALDAINEFCESRQDKEDGLDCCSDCILKDCCLDTPVRSTFEASVKAAQEALKTIKKSKGTVSEVRDPMLYGNSAEAVVIDEFIFAKEAE